MNRCGNTWRVRVNDVLTAKHLQSFRDYLFQEEKSAATIEKYCRDVQKFLSFAGEDVLTKELTISYKNHLEEFERTRAMTMKSKLSIMIPVGIILIFCFFRMALPDIHNS